MRRAQHVVQWSNLNASLGDVPRARLYHDRKRKARPGARPALPPLKGRAGGGVNPRERLPAAAFLGRRMPHGKPGAAGRAAAPKRQGARAKPGEDGARLGARRPEPGRGWGNPAAAAPHHGGKALQGRAKRACGGRGPDRARRPCGGLCSRGIAGGLPRPARRAARSAPAKPGKARARQWRARAAAAALCAAGNARSTAEAPTSTRRPAGASGRAARCRTGGASIPRSDAAARSTGATARHSAPPCGAGAERCAVQSAQRLHRPPWACGRWARPVSIT